MSPSQGEDRRPWESRNPTLSRGLPSLAPILTPKEQRGHSGLGVRPAPGSPGQRRPVLPAGHAAAAAGTTRSLGGRSPARPSPAAAQGGHLGAPPPAPRADSPPGAPPGVGAPVAAPVPAPASARRTHGRSDPDRPAGAGLVCGRPGRARAPLPAQNQSDQLRAGRLRAQVPRPGRRAGGGTAGRGQAERTAPGADSAERTEGPWAGGRAGTGRARPVIPGGRARGDPGDPGRALPTGRPGPPAARSAAPVQRTRARPGRGDRKARGLCPPRWCWTGGGGGEGPEAPAPPGSLTGPGWGAAGGPKRPRRHLAPRLQLLPTRAERGRASSRWTSPGPGPPRTLHEASGQSASNSPDRGCPGRRLRWLECGSDGPRPPVRCRVRAHETLIRESICIHKRNNKSMFLSFSFPSFSLK